VISLGFTDPRDILGPRIWPCHAVHLAPEVAPGVGYGGSFIVLIIPVALLYTPVPIPAPDYCYLVLTLLS
jgi:hypothetical protein